MRLVEERAKRVLRVAFFGGMANNCYLAAKCMHASGVDVSYIRDIDDNYAMSQPIWAEKRLFKQAVEIAATSSWTPDQWDDLAEKTSWSPPEWIVDPRQLRGSFEPLFRDTGDVSVGNYTPAPAHYYRSILHHFQKFELIFVSNVHAIILAMLSGRPFVICPAGGELMVATGQITGQGAVGFTLKQQEVLLRKAFQRSRGVITNTRYLDHASLTGSRAELLSLFPKSKLVRVSLPFAVSPVSDAASKRRLLDATLAELGERPIQQTFAAFIPSRIDFQWKGQDIIMQAIDQLPEAAEFAFIFSGWGADLNTLTKWAAGRRNVRMLGKAMSWPILNDLYRGSDLVIDQLRLGHIGTAAREAAAAGTPVMAYIESPMRENAGEGCAFDRPELPVLNACDAATVGEWLRGIASGTVDLELHAQEGRDWIARYASSDLMHSALERAASVG